MLRKTFTHKLSGFSLVELVIATVIIGIFAVSGMSGFSLIRGFIQRDADKLEAFSFTQETIESLMDTDYADPLLASADPPGITYDPAPDPDGNFANSRLATDLNGQRFYTVVNYHYPGVADPTIGKRIIVTVQWTDRIQRTAVIETLKTDTQ